MDYAGEYARAGFQGPLQGYRCWTDGSHACDLGRLAGLRIEGPALFVAGASDWGPFQAPSALKWMGTHACTRFAVSHLVEGAGHRVQQERPEVVADLILTFLHRRPDLMSARN